ncbi:MAG: hypothetical protein HF973_17100 [Chloroflexi bacterium]|nr:hypothetical protein [Chloroflexota bacterium]
MTHTNNYALRLQTSLLNELRRVAKEEGTSINQLINVAVAEKLAALRTESYFRERMNRTDKEAFMSILEKAGANIAIEGDELPAE